MRVTGFPGRGLTDGEEEEDVDGKLSSVSVVSAEVRLPCACLRCLRPRSFRESR